jgi:hypothetical protein
MGNGLRAAGAAGAAGTRMQAHPSEMSRQAVIGRRTQAWFDAHRARPSERRDRRYAAAAP